MNREVCAMKKEKPLYRQIQELTVVIMEYFDCYYHITIGLHVQAHKGGLSNGKS